MIILEDSSAIFLASPLSIQAWEFSKWHGFPKLLSPFQGPNRFVALLPQSHKIFQYHNEYRMLSSLVRTLPVKFHQLLVRLQKTLMTLAVYTVNRIFQKVFTTVDQITKKYTLQAFTSFKLTHYKCPEQYFHNEILEIDISIPDAVVSAILILSVTFAPLTGFHASKRRDISLCHENSRSSAKCPRMYIYFKSPDNKLLYSNFGEYQFGGLSSFLFFFVNACRNNHTRVSSHTLQSRDQTKSRVPNICLAAMFTES